MIFIGKDKSLVTYKLYQSMENKESTLFYAMADFIAICSGFSLVPWFRAGVSSLQDLMPDHLRWNWCKNTKNKVSNKHNALELPLPLPWSMEKLSSMKLVPGAKKVGDHWSKRFPKGQSLEGLYFRERKEEGLCRLRGHRGDKSLKVRIPWDFGAGWECKN